MLKAIVNGAEKDIVRIPMIGDDSTYKEGWEIRDQQDRLIWGKNNTLTGVSSISFRGYGVPLKSIKIVGNSQQIGTPAPDAPIMPQFVGERTGNVLPNLAKSIVFRGVTYTVNADKSITIVGKATPQISYLILAGDGAAENSLSLYSTPVFKAGDSIIASTKSATSLSFRYTDGSYSSEIISGTPVTLSKDVGLVYVQVLVNQNADTTVYPMICYSDNVAENYVPYGYKIPITCAGQTTPIYLGQIQTVRRIKKLVLTGEEVISGVHESSTAGVYCASMRFSNCGATDIIDCNKNMAKITYPCFVCSHLKMKKAPSSDDMWHNISEGEIGANSYSPDASTKYYNLYFIFCIPGCTTIQDFQNYFASQYAAGTPVTIWYVIATPETAIVNEPLAKIGTYADTLTSEQAGITIPTTDGNNIISVDTSLAPSKMTITGHIRDVWFEQSITGVPPLSFKSNGMPLISLNMKGNSQQNGTPAPDAPIMPTFCGDRTGNLAPNISAANGWRVGYLTNQGTYTNNNPRGEILSPMISIKDFSSFTISATEYSVPSMSVYYFNGNSYISSSGASDYDGSTFSNFPANATHFYFAIRTGYQTIDSVASHGWHVMLNSGSTALPYEPYGYKIPITNAGQTQNVYLGQVQAVRKIRKLVLTGEEAWRKSTNFPGGFFVPWSSLGGISASPARCTHAYGVPNGKTYVYGTFLSDAINFNIRIMQPGTEKTEWEQFLSDQYVAGTPVVIWYVLATPTTGIVNEPLCKIGDYADELTTDPNITPQTGTNTLTVDTTLSPSSVSITGYIKQE